MDTKRTNTNGGPLTGLAAGAVAVLLCAATTQAAITAPQRCEAGKNDASGKYAACAAKAQKTLVATGDASRYDLAVAKCEDKLTAYWNKLEAAAATAGTACPSSGDQTPIETFVDACVQSVAEAVSGGVLGPDPVTCAADLATCDASLTACTGNLGMCNGNMSTCTGDLWTCNSSLTTCSGNLSNTNADLGTCTGNLGTCNTNLTSCTGNLATCNANLTSCTGDMATCSVGTAAAADVLSGKTFSSNAGLGVTGTMADNGAVSITPAVSAQAIAAGYHNGSGSVAGDADLAASNIVSGVEIFGVTGTVSAGLPAQPLKTGQTTAYGAGSDGDLRKGISSSFTDNGDGTVTDNMTGLMWEKKSDDAGIHDKDNTYTWGMTSSPYTMNGTIVTTFLAALNGDGGFAGYTDWRIPNLKELQSLQNFATYNPGTYPAFNSGCTASCSVTTCSCTQSNHYWSSSTVQYYPHLAWLVYFGHGGTTYIDKTNSYYVRGVRAGS